LALDLERSYVEASGAIEKIILKIIGDDTEKKIPASQLKPLTGKEPLAIDDDGYHYQRKIGNNVHTKAMYGTTGKHISKPTRA